MMITMTEYSQMHLHLNLKLQMSDKNFMVQHLENTLSNKVQNEEELQKI